MSIVSRWIDVDESAQPLGEFELIKRYFVQPRTTSTAALGVKLGIGDDAALLQVPPGTELVAAVDTIVAGRHFLESAAAYAIGYRALAVNLSDLAAMGADPAWATLALTLPQADSAWLQGFAAGFADLAAEHGVTLVGGDTTSGPLTISVQIMGTVPCGSALRRDTARAGDLLAVTGTLGDAGAGLAIATGRLVVDASDVSAALLRRFEYPTPRVSFGRSARGIASAAMDLSDGLAGDLPKLASASGLQARVHVEQLPLSSALCAAVDKRRAREWALSAGDDYELLLAVPSSRWSDLKAHAAQLNLTLCIIGELCPGNGIEWLHDGEPFAAPANGFDHFR